MLLSRPTDRSNRPPPSLIKKYSATSPHLASSRGVPHRRGRLHLVARPPALYSALLHRRRSPHAAPAPLASSPVTAVAPRCKWRRRLHQDTMHVSSVHFKCFRCFRGTLQVFHMDITKVDQGVTYVAMVVHICCKHLSVFRLFFQTYLASVFIWILHMFQHKCCKCFIWMLRMFAMFFKCFLGVSDASTSSCYDNMMRDISCHFLHTAST